MNKQREEKVFYTNRCGVVQKRMRINKDTWDETLEYALRDKISIDTTTIEVLQNYNKYFARILSLARASIPKGVFVTLFVSKSIQSLKMAPPTKFIEWRYTPKTKQFQHIPKVPRLLGAGYYLGRIAIN